jgi:SAM-dependent methyltransferase
MSPPTIAALSDDEWTALRRSRPLRGLNVGCGGAFHRCYPEAEQFLHTDVVSLQGANGARSQPGRPALVNGRLLYLQHDATQPFPFADGSFDWIFCEHTIEHLKPLAALALLRELRRLIKPGGVVRMSTPDLALFVAGYQDPAQTFFRRYAEHLARAAQESPVLAERYAPRLTGAEIDAERSYWRNLDPAFDLSGDDRDAFLARVAQTLRTRFAQPAVMMNQIFQLYGHEWIYDWDELRFWVERAGFDARQLRRAAYRQGRDVELAGLDQPLRSEESLYAEIDG